MDTIFYQNPVATVQLIPVFHYLKILSDFLYIKNYLTEIDQNKQIPVVNALYEYLEDHRYNVPMTVELTRKLLQGSDLYGEQDGENLDPIFVNSMFDFIISSLVFDKYGNIYGFLADSIRRAENLQFDYVMKVIKLNLENATFENEFGYNSQLNRLAINRIFNDIILPLFPQPNTDLSLLSLDYTIAQAGSIFLRLGRLNATYYPDSENYTFTKYNKNPFEEYLAVGHIIVALLHKNKISPVTLRVFALPALLYYIYNEEKVKNEAIQNVIFHPHHWKSAYDNFFADIVYSFKQVENQLIQDFTYKMHEAFLDFQSRASITKIITDLQCNFSSYNDTGKQIPAYIEYTKHYECESDDFLLNIENLFMQQIQNVGEIYEKYALEIIQQSIKKSLIDDLQGSVIKLLVPKNQVFTGDSNNSHHAFYDLLEFYFPDSKILDFYGLITENYTVTLIERSDNPKLFHEKFNISLDTLLSQVTYHVVILKSANERLDEFYKRLLRYKKERFLSYLTNSDDNRTRKEWWNEFGLSLVPSYSCLLNNKNSCKDDNMNFFNKFQEDISSHITNKHTQSMLSSLGTNVKTICVKDFFIKRINNYFKNSRYESLIFPRNETALEAVYDKLSLRIEEPENENISITKDSIRLVTTIINDFREKIDNRFSSVDHMLNKMEFLKSSIVKKIGVVGENKSELLLVNSFNGNNGFGYKYIISDKSIDNIEIAQLRTDYDFNGKIFVIAWQDSSKNGKIYRKLNNTTLKCENDNFVYEINNQLRRKSSKLLFSRIIQHDNNDNCNNREYLEKTKFSNVCRRQWHLIEKVQLENEAVQIIKNNTILARKNVSEEEIRNTLKKYTFPDDKTFLSYFAKRWVDDANFEESDWSKTLLIDNSDLFNKLRYDIRLGNNIVTIMEGERRINLTYTYRERRRIEQGTSIENIINDYNEQEASYSVTFEDYYAIRNFATTGDTRISRDTNEAKLMKLALYKLAIRQSDDPDVEFELKLFRAEYMSADIVNKELKVGKHVNLRKFTLTATSVASATRFSAYPASGFRNVLYEMEFFCSYFRAKIETKVGNFEIFKENQIILLPGSEFLIKKITIVKIGGVGNVLKVLLTCTCQNIVKYLWQKNIMSEITRMIL